MQIRQSQFKPFPTGRLLVRERARLLLLPADVARAVGCHRQCISTLERMNRVIPPGWLEALRGLGMQIHDPTWPQDMRPYLGTDWAEEIRTRIGLGHSAFRWSRKLGVTEEAVRAVLRSREPVPHGWLLKLAELGVEVPAPVRQALDRIATYPRTNAVREPSSKLEEELAQLREVLRPREEKSAQSSAAPKEKPPERRREQSSVYLHWTESNGLHFSMSTALLDQLPSLFKELLARLLAGVQT